MIKNPSTGFRAVEIRIRMKMDVRKLLRRNTEDINSMLSLNIGIDKQSVHFLVNLQSLEEQLLFASAKPMADDHMSRPLRR